MSNGLEITIVLSFFKRFLFNYHKRKHTLILKELKISKSPMAESFQNSEKLL